jgi:hypothetical protein
MRIASFVGICLIAWNSAFSDCLGQERDSDICYIAVRKFNVPFRVSDNGIREIRFHEFSDQGLTWKQVAVAKPDEKQFRVETKKDGLYWYAVQIIDPEKAIPAKLDRSTCGLKVIVDTVPPKVELEVLPAPKGEVALTWRITDDHLDLRDTRLEYRRYPDGEWTQLEINPAAGKHSWRSPMMPIDVRLRARDFAGNSAAVTIRVPAAPAK